MDHALIYVIAGVLVLVNVFLPPSDTPEKESADSDFDWFNFDD